jgi:hypothetical protein
MKKYTSLALIGALVVGMAGFISLDAISATSFGTMQVASDIHETGKMIGHVTYELRGTDGNIKHYSQSDNVIVDVGTDCAATSIFDTTDSSAICTLGTDNGFSFIAIGNSTVTFPLASVDDIALDDDTVDGREMQRLAGTVSITPADSGNNVDTLVSIVSPAFLFNELGPAGTVITQSGLFDSDVGGSNNMFSVRDIPGQGGTGLAVTNADTLSVTWTITLE